MKKLHRVSNGSSRSAKFSMHQEAELMIRFALVFCVTCLSSVGTKSSSAATIFELKLGVKLKLGVRS